MEEIEAIMKLPEFDLKNFSILDLECKVLRKYYIELASVLFINNISRYFLSEFILDHREFDKVTDPFAHKDKATTFLNIVHGKMKEGDTQVFRTMLDTLHFYGDKPLREVVDKMRIKVFEMKVNKRGDIEQRRSDRIAKRKEKYYEQDDYPIKNIPDFSTYRVILRCILKVKTTMTAIFKRVDIHIVRQACIMNARTPNGPWLSKHLINAILLVETSEELFEMLMHYHQLDWINFTIVESLVKYTKSELGQKVLDSYKKYTLQLNFLTVYTINSRVPKIEDPGPEYTRIKEILSIDLFKTTVGKLLEHRTFLEKEIFDINEASTRMASFDHHRCEVVWIIPEECSYHAYKSANSNVHKFNIILSLEIEDYPIIKNTVELPVEKPHTLEATTVEFLDRYGTVLLEQLNAPSIIPILVERRLLSSDEARIINSAPTEYQKNSYILDRVQDMDNRCVLRFCDILQSQGHHQHIGMPMMNEIFHVEQKENGSMSPAGGEGVNSESEVTSRKRLSSHSESPHNKQIKLLAVSRRFASVVREIGKSIKSANLKMLCLYVGSLEANKDPKINLFSSELLSGLDKCDNVTMFLSRYSFQWSWMDYGFLEDLLRAGRCEKGTKILEKFKSELGQVKFLSSFAVPSPCRKMLPTDEGSYTILTLMVDCKLFECTLHYISELKVSFTDFCGILRHSIQLIAVKQISIASTIFYWVVLRPVVPLICNKVQANRTKLRSTGVLEVSIYPNVVMATDAEVRIGSLAFLTINGGIFDDNVKAVMSRSKELPEVVAKLQCELDQCKSQLQEKNVVVTESSVPCNGEDHTMDTTPADQEKYRVPFDDVVDMITTSINEDAECQHEAITQLTSANKEEADKTHLIDIWLKKKSHYCLQLEKYVSKECLDQIFSTTWELREAGLKQLAQDVTFLLMPEFPCHHRSKSRNWKLPRYPNVREVLESSCAIVAYCFTDKVLAVYQAALRVCWVILYNALCTSEEELDELREFFKPVLSSLIARYDDRELSVRQATKIFLQHFFHGQTGALFTINNPFGAFHTSGLFYIYSCLLTVPVHKKISENWWMTRLNFISDTFCKYGDYYFPQEDLPSLDYYGARAPYRSREPDLPIPDEESLAVLTLVWRFVANATNRTHNHDAVSTAAQVYRNTIQIIGKYARGLGRARELLIQCHPSVVDEIREVIDGYQKRLDKSIEDGWRYNYKGYYRKLNAIAYSDLKAKSSVDTEKPLEEDPLIKMWDGKQLDKDKAVALAKYRAIDVRMYPPIFLRVPTDDMIFHIQGYLANGMTYREGMEWIKGQSINDVNYLYRAQDIRTGTIMAVSQRPLSGFSSYHSRKEQLLKEVSLVVKLDHANVVRYFGASMEEDLFNIFQEWVAGGSLQQLLNDTRGLHPSVVTTYAKQLIRGVVYLHGNGIIHRNLCDVTVLIDHSGQRLKVSDFSYAVKVTDDEPTEQREISDNYKCYNVFFTAPEVLRRESYGMSSDVWSVGCCVVMMATGNSPWAVNKSCDPYIDIVRVATGKPPPAIPSSLSGKLADWVIRCLDITPEDRLKLLDIPERHLLHTDISA